MLNHVAICETVAWVVEDQQHSPTVLSDPGLRVKIQALKLVEINPGNEGLKAPADTVANDRMPQTSQGEAMRDHGKG